MIEWLLVALGTLLWPGTMKGGNTHAGEGGYHAAAAITICHHCAAAAAVSSTTLLPLLLYDTVLKSSTSLVGWVLTADGSRLD